MPRTELYQDDYWNRPWQGNQEDRGIHAHGKGMIPTKANLLAGKTQTAIVWQCQVCPEAEMLQLWRGRMVVIEKPMVVRPTMTGTVTMIECSEQHLKTRIEKLWKYLREAKMVQRRLRS